MLDRSVLSGSLAGLIILILIGWIPLFGPLIAGIVAGSIARGAIRGLVAGLIAGVLGGIFLGLLIIPAIFGMVGLFLYNDFSIILEMPSIRGLETGLLIAIVSIIMLAPITAAGGFIGGLLRR